MVQKTQPPPRGMTTQGSGWCLLRATLPYQFVLTLQKQLLLMPVAISHVLMDAWGNNESLLRSVILCVNPSSNKCNYAPQQGQWLYFPVFAVRDALSSDSFFFLVLVSIHWLQLETPSVSLAKTNLVSLIEWLGLTSCSNKDTLKWLYMYYHSSLGCSLAPRSVIAVIFIRNLHNIHAQLWKRDGW